MDSSIFQKKWFSENFCDYASQKNFDVIQRINASKLEVRSTDFCKKCQTIKKLNQMIILDFGKLIGLYVYSGLV